MSTLPNIPGSTISQPINERHRPLNKTNIINFSKAMEDNFMVQHAWFFDEERQITLCIQKEHGTNYSLDTIRENSGRRPYLNENTTGFKEMVTRFATPEYGRQPVVYVGYAQSPNFDTKGHTGVTLLLATTSIDRMAEDVVNYLLPLVQIKKLSAAERMKKDREPVTFSGLYVVKYDSTKYRNDFDGFWKPLKEETEDFSKLTLKHLRIMREKFVAEIRLDHIGNINLYKLFIWDHLASGFLLNDEYCFEVFGLSGSKLGFSRAEILDPKKRR